MEQAPLNLERVYDIVGELEPRLNETIEASESWYNKAMKKRGFLPRPDPELYLKWWEDQLGIR